MIEPPCKGHDVWRHLTLVLFVPSATLELLWQDVPEHGEVEEGELGGQVLGGHRKWIQQSGGHAPMTRQTRGLSGGRHVEVSGGTVDQILVNLGWLGGPSLNWDPDRQHGW